MVGILRENCDWIVLDHTWIGVTEGRLGGLKVSRRGGKVILCLKGQGENRASSVETVGLSGGNLNFCL